MEGKAMRNFFNLYDDHNWETADDYYEGTKIKVLREEKGSKTFLLKLPKGFFMAPHSHLTTEQHFVLEGSYLSGGKKYENIT